MDGKTCCFFGHSRIYEDIDRALEDAVERHIVEYGVTEFLVGNYGQFDGAAAWTVKRSKARHPGVHLYLMLAYHPDLGRPLPDRTGYDNFIYPEGLEGVPLKLAIPRLNRIMVQDSDYAIAYVKYTWGGAANTLEAAQRKARRGGLVITNLG